MTTPSKPTNASCMDDFDPASLPVDKALQQIKQSIKPLVQSERVPLPKLLDRVLAEDVRSPINVPPYTNSAMDGYAIDGTSLPDKNEKSFKLAGTVFAGIPLDKPVPENFCARIMTGGKMPEGTDTVIMQEHVQTIGDNVVIDSDHTRGQNVRHAGEDVTKNEVVLSAGKRISPADIGLLASLGIEQATVRPQLKVAIFSTGDELVPLGTPLKSGQIYDSNRYTLLAMLSHFGACILDYGVIRDNRQQVEQAFATAAAKADVLITTGGVSVGEADFVKETLDKLGEVNFWKIAMKPGRPLAYGKINDCYFFGLPGNPVSTMVTFYQFVQPALKQLQGEAESSSLILPLRCTTPIRKVPGRLEYQRGIIEYDANGALTVRSTGEQGSHIMSSMVKANCFIILPMECKGVDAGEIVDVQPFAGIV